MTSWGTSSPFFKAQFGPLTLNYIRVGFGYQDYENVLGFRFMCRCVGLKKVNDGPRLMVLRIPKNQKRLWSNSGGNEKVLTFQKNRLVAPLKATKALFNPQFEILIPNICPGCIFKVNRPGLIFHENRVFDLGPPHKRFIMVQFVKIFTSVNQFEFFTKSTC